MNLPRPTRPSRPGLPGVAQAPPAVRAARGMTLIEVMMATGILVFGMVAILAIILTAQRSHQRAVNETNAVLVANSVLSELRAIMDKGRLPETYSPDKPFEQLPQHRDYPDYRYAVGLKCLEAQRRNPKAPLLGEEYCVEVTVFWAQRGEAQSVTFQTVMFLRLPVAPGPGSRSTAPR
jgi:type II secretory pathway pseudopilin PulG